MNSQELRALQEAYSQVYELDEELTGPRKERAQQLLRSKMTASGRAKPGQKQNIDQLMRVTSIRGDFRKNKPPIEGSGNKSKRRRGIDVPDTRKEQVDIYDIILSHLLDEGYADTEQAAEVIMVNMSEDWRESIMEADSLAAMAARREKRLKAQRKREGTSATGQDWGHNYGQTAAQREVANKAEFDAFIKRKK
jgi:hypothetical protein